MERIRVLCVEDRPEYMEALTYMLQAAGCTVTPATSGGQAVDLISNNPVDAVLLEYYLPDVSGGVVGAEIKRIKPEIPVLLFCRRGRSGLFFFQFLNIYFHDLEQQENVLRN